MIQFKLIAHQRKCCQTKTKKAASKFKLFTDSIKTHLANSPASPPPSIRSISFSLNSKTASHTQFCPQSTLSILGSDFSCLDAASSAACAQLAPITPSPPLPPPTRPEERPRRSLCRRNGTSTRGVPILVARFDGPGPSAQRQQRHGAQLNWW